MVTLRNLILVHEGLRCVMEVLVGAVGGAGRG
jgi:hypothetical protein